MIGLQVRLWNFDTLHIVLNIASRSCASIHTWENQFIGLGGTSQNDMLTLGQIGIFRVWITVRSVEM